MLEYAYEYFLDEHRKEIKKIIYQKVHEYTLTQDGIKIGKLAKIIGLDRSNIKKYLDDLIKEKIIKREKGFQGKYYTY